jgi:hypothetical protein
VWVDSQILQVRGWVPGSSKFPDSLYRDGVNVLLLCPLEWAVFHIATEECKRIRPKTRDEAVAVFQRIDASFGIAEMIWSH